MQLLSTTSAFEALDYIIFGIYVTIIVAVGLYLSRGNKDKERSGEDYFLAGRNLTWWAIGASLIAANISAEHFIGMSGSGYALGLGIAAYEWMAAITLLVVAKYFLPIFLEKGIYTTNQFLATRFNQGVSSAFAIMWLLVYVFVNLTTVTYLGATALNAILGIDVLTGIIGLAVIAGIYSIYGGLVAVAWTDVIQVIFLIGGGLVTTYLALEYISPGSVLDGFGVLVSEGADHFNMVFERGETMIPGDGGGSKDAYIDLPGVAVIIGAMWLTNLGYWGFNQYIIQKGLAAKNIQEAKKGLLFASFLKILIPLIVVIPGIAAYVFFQKEAADPGYLAELLGKPMEEIGTIAKSDSAYPWLLKNFVPTGIRGLAFAALVAAIISSLASMINSTSTIFTVDIYKPLINKDATEKQMVSVGRIVALIALIVSTAAAQPLLGQLDQAFQYIQEYTGLIYPGVAVVFSMGLFWKRANTSAAIAVALLTLPLGIGAKFMFSEMMEGGMPFLLRMGYVFIALVAVGSLFIFFDKRNEVKETAENMLSEAVQTMMVRASIVFGILAVASLIYGVLNFTSLNGIGIESLIFFGTLMAMIGIVLYTNAKSEVADANTLRYTPEIFKTSLGFNIGALTVIVIVGILYGVFW
ncbi:MAG: sodium/solute symporter [Bacteroidota bacterium]